MAIVSGVVTYQGSQNGQTIRIGLFPVNQAGAPPTAGLVLFRPGPYSLDDVPPGTYDARAVYSRVGAGGEEIFAYATHQPGPLVIDPKDRVVGINFNLGDVNV